MLVVSPTYAKFASSFSTEEDVVGLTLSFNLGISNVEEYEEVVVEASSYEVFHVNIKNSSSVMAYYGVWYKMVTPLEINDDITIARLIDTETTTSGSIDVDGEKTVTVVIENLSNETIKVNIGVGSSTTGTSDIEYLGGKYLITGTCEYPVIVNNPNIDSGNLIPVYYDDTDEVWRKADSNNGDNNWYDYKNKKWANAILKDSNTVVDLSNHLNNGTLVGGITWDKTNHTISTDGVDDNVNLGFQNYDFGSDISLVVRVKFDSLTSASQSVFANFELGGCGIYLNGNNYLTFEVYLNGAYTIYTSSFIPTVGTWYTFVAVYDGSYLRVYSNGEEIGSVEGTGSIGISTAPFVIGGNPGADGFISGASVVTVSDALLFDRVITASEVASNYSGVPNPVNQEDLLVYYDFSDKNAIPVGTVLGDSVEDGTLGFYVWIPRYK